MKDYTCQFKLKLLSRNQKLTLLDYISNILDITKEAILAMDLKLKQK